MYPIILNGSCSILVYGEEDAFHKKTVSSTTSYNCFISEVVQKVVIDGKITQFNASVRIPGNISVSTENGVMIGSKKYKIEHIDWTHSPLANAVVCTNLYLM